MATKVYRCSICLGLGHNKRTCFFGNKIDDLDRLVELECEKHLINFAISASMPTTPTFSNFADETDVVLPLPSAPEMPVAVGIDEVQPAYANHSMAILEEALAHAQTRAREAEEKVDILMAQNETLKTTLLAKERELQQCRFMLDLETDRSKSTKEEVEKLKSELQSVLSSNATALQTISALLDENEKLSSNKLSDAEEFALLLDQYDVHRTYTACRDRAASGQGSDEDTFTREVLSCWLDLLENFKSGKSIWFDKHGNTLAILVKKLITGWKEPGWLPAFTVPRHGTVPHINYNLAKWLKQKGYLPCDFTFNGRMMNPEEHFCFAVVLGFLYIWVMFAWMVSYESGDQQTKDFLFWDAVVDDPFIAWYMSSGK